jgi:hypothetical protein
LYRSETFCFDFKKYSGVQQTLRFALYNDIPYRNVMKRYDIILKRYDVILKRYDIILKRYDVMLKRYIILKRYDIILETLPYHTETL